MKAMLPNTMQLVEGAMHRQWRIRRQASPHPDAQQRWDQAYQLLLQWTQPIAAVNELPIQPLTQQPEVCDDDLSSDLCSRFHAATDRIPDD
jgi:hypothetical protein